MTKFNLSSSLKKTFATFMMVFVLFMNFPFQAYADLISVDIQANGQNSLTLATSTDSFDISVNSTNATSCQLTSPLNSGISTSATMHVAPGDANYPSIGGSVTFSVTCDDGTGVTATDSVVISLPAIIVPPATPTVDVKVNSSDGPVTLSGGANYSYTWTSNNATSCQLTSPLNSGLSLSGLSPVISPGDSLYPTAGSPVTIAVTCTDGTTTVSDSVVVSVTVVPPAGTPTVDVKVNGSDGPVSLTSPATYTYTWTSTNATSCQLTSPLNSGLSLSGTSPVISPGDSLYPTVATSTTITVTCANGANTATDTVVVSLNVVPPPAGTPTVDVKVNGSDGPVSLTSPATYTYTWTSTNATSCQLSSPLNSGLSNSGTSPVINPGDALYPTAGSPVTITVTCTNGVTTVSDSVVVSLTSGGGGSCTLPTITSSLSTSVQINNAFSYTVTTSSTSTPTFSIGASVLPSGLSFSTSTGVFSGTPTQTGSFNIAVTATNPCGTDTKTVVLTVDAVTPVTPVVPVTPPSGGGGGGGSSSGGHRHPVITPTAFNDLSCLYLKDYLRQDFNNDPIEVMKLQAFLKSFEGYDTVTVNGVFDQATFDAVSAFQAKYSSDILAPWGETKPTGYVYILTLKKINEIYCQKAFPVSDQDQLEINAHKALYDHLNGTSTPVDNTEVGLISPLNNGSTTSVLPIVGQVTPQGQNFLNVGAALFSIPTTLMGLMQCLYEFILILIVLYILGNVLKDVLYEDKEENRLKRFMTKWLTITIGLIIAAIIVYLIHEWCLLLPILIALLISVIWMIFYPQHDSIKAHFKSWYIVLRARAKSMWINFKAKFDKSTVITVTTESTTEENLPLIVETVSKVETNSSKV